MEIIYKTNVIPSTEQIISLYDKAGLPRPTTDKARIEKIYQHSNLIVSAWQDDKLVGVCRSITDWAWSCYLADLAVDPAIKQTGIGKKLVALTKETVGEEVMIILLSVPTAFEYYPKIGFEKENRAFSMKREK